MSLKSIQHLIWIFGLVLLVFSACQDKRTTEDIQIYQGYEYFPLEVGKYIEYTMDSIIFDTTAIGIVIDTSQTLVREEIVETFEDLVGQTNYRIERYERKSALEEWSIKSVYSALRNSTQGLRTEDNFKFLKLVFPLEEGEIWDGNQFIDPSTTITVAGETIEIYKDWLYEIDDMHKIEVFNSIPFDSVMTVYQAQNENLIEYRYSVEKYATGVGLVYREQWILDTQCIADCVGLTWEQKAQKGFIIKQTITDYN